MRNIPNGHSLAFAATLVLLWLMLSLMTHLWLVPQKSPHDYDFFPSWYSARAILTDSVNPYDDAFNREMRIEMGYPADQNYRQRFYYPATMIWILLPFWILPFPIAIVLWNGLQLLLTFALPLLVFVRLGWRIRSPLFALIAVFSAIPWRHSANMYVLGQFVMFTLACLVLAWIFITQRQLLLAALALVGSTMRAEGIILTAAFLLVLLLSRQYRVIFYWMMMMGSLFVLSLITTGFWIPDFLDGIQGYRDSQVTTFPPSVVGHELLSYAIAASIVLWGGYMLYDVFRLPLFHRLAWSLAVLCLVMLLVLVQTKDYTLVYALFPIWIVIWAGRDQPWILIVMLSIMISPWGYDALKANQGHGSATEQFLTPLAILIFLTYQWHRHRRLITTIRTPRGSTTNT